MDLQKLIIGNAAGTVKTIEDVQKLCNSAVTRITVGSITKQKREGNRGETYYFDPATNTSINSIGLRNEGIEWYHLAGKLRRMVQLAHAAGKELWASVVGSSPEEFVELADTCFGCGVDGVELNFGCPNVHDGDKTKPVLSYDPASCQVILDHMDAAFTMGHKQISMKISPVPNDIARDLFACANTSQTITEVPLCNTEPNQELKKPDGSPALAYYPQGGQKLMHVGGRAGAPLKQEVLRLLPVACETLFPSMRIMVVGGIFSGADVVDYEKAARNSPRGRSIDGFQVGTAYYDSEDPAVFTNIATELVQLLEPA